MSASQTKPTKPNTRPSRPTALCQPTGEAVMMGWEKPLMIKHAELICAKGGDVLNVGFGLGLVDTAIQVGLLYRLQHC